MHKPIPNSSFDSAFLFSKNKLVIFFCVLLSLFYVESRAQNDTLVFGHFSIEHGLSHKDVTSIIQDSLGFMWYGTRAGLNKFDGYHFVSFKHDPKDKNSLASDNISCMSVDRSGIIWIGTKMKGIDRLDPYTGIFTNYQHQEEVNESLSENEITSILADTVNHLVWIGTASTGLNVLNPSNGKFTVYKYTGDVRSLSHNNITCVKIDSHGRIWVGTAGGGLNVTKDPSGGFRHFRRDPTGKISLSSDTITDVFVSKDDVVWIATPNGLNRMDINSGTVTIFKHNKNDPTSISSDDLTSVYQDKYGKIWVGTRANGLNVYYPSNQRFYLYSRESSSQNSLSSDSINSISQGRSGMFWAATPNGGLNAFNPKSLKFKLNAPFGRNWNINMAVSSIIELSPGELLLSVNHKGIYQFFINGPDQKCELIKPCNAEFLGSISWTDWVIFVATDGLYSYVPSDKSFQKILELKDISCCIRGRAGKLWIGTESGQLYTYDLASRDLMNVQLPKLSSRISSLFVDHAGILWVGSFGDGCLKLDPIRGSIKRYINNLISPFLGRRSKAGMLYF